MNTPRHARVIVLAAAALFVAAETRAQDLQKSLPGSILVAPSLDQARLWVVSAAGIVTTRTASLYTYGTSPITLRVGGNPTQYRTSQSTTFWDGEWKPATVASGGSMNVVRHEIKGGDGPKTIYLQLANSYGKSPVYKVDIQFLEFYTCTLRYERADNALAPFGEPQGSLGVETATIARGESKALNVDWPSANEKRVGYGMHLRRARNDGRHTVRLTIGGGISWSTVDVPPGALREYRADLKRIHCP